MSFGSVLPNRTVYFLAFVPSPQYRPRPIPSNRASDIVLTCLTANGSPFGGVLLINGLASGAAGNAVLIHVVGYFVQRTVQLVRDFLHRFTAGKVAIFKISLLDHYISITLLCNGRILPSLSAKSELF